MTSQCLGMVTLVSPHCHNSRSLPKEPPRQAMGIHRSLNPCLELNLPQPRPVYQHRRVVYPSSQICLMNTARIETPHTSDWSSAWSRSRTFSRSSRSRTIEYSRLASMVRDDPRPAHSPAQGSQIELTDPPLTGHARAGARLADRSQPGAIATRAVRWRFEQVRRPPRVIRGRRQSSWLCSEIIDASGWYMCMI